MTASSSKVGCRESGAFFVPARPSKDPSPGRGVQAKPTFQAALVLTFRPGLLDGFIRISTSIPASLANCSNFSMENFPSRPPFKSGTSIECVLVSRHDNQYISDIYTTQAGRAR